MGFLGMGSKVKSEQQLMLEQEQRQFDFSREQNVMNTQTSSLPDEFQQDKVELVKWQQDLHPELEALKHDLRSEYLTENGWKLQMQPTINVRIVSYRNEVIGGKTYRRPLIKKEQVMVRVPALMNEYGIRMVETELRPLLSRNLMMSNLDENRILETLRRTAFEICDNITENYDVYNISFENFSYVMRLIKNVMIPTFYRALNDGERRHLRSVHKSINTYNETTQPKTEKKMFGMPILPK